MKKIANGKHINKGYLYKGYEVRNHGYHTPEVGLLEFSGISRNQ